MTTLVGALPLVLAAVIAAPAPASIAHIHGRIVAIDVPRGTFLIHHDPFALMPIAMTMEVEPRRRGVLATLHVGEIVDATVDTAIVPWPAGDVRPARPRERQR